jgi:hypothetical protein
MPEELFKMIKKDALRINGILYAPPNFLKMGMYLELSRPIGDNSRFEKVFKRLTLLNKTYPLTSLNCGSVDFQRTMKNPVEEDVIYETTKDALVHQGVVFFGGYATSLYSKYMPQEHQHLIKKIPDFDVLSEEPEKTAEIIKERLVNAKFKHVKIIKHSEIGEIIPFSYEIRVGEDTMALIYEPIACHSYNKIEVDNKIINIATIDTILTFYLGFLYTDLHYYDKDRLLCMAKFLFDVQHKNRLRQSGLLKRFTMDCFGKQKTIEDMRAEKAVKYKELKNDRNSKDFQMWFLRYIPAELHKSKKHVVDVKEPNDSESGKFFGLFDQKNKTIKNRPSPNNFLY